MNNSRDKKISSLKDLPHEILKTAYSTGVIAAENERSGSFLHLNQTTVYDQINESFKNQIIMMDTKDALQKYDWLEQYFWKLVDKDKDEFTKRVAEDWSGGYFFWIQKKAKVTFPLQSCLLITKDNFEQRVHNIIIADEGSQAHIITGCAQHANIDKANHLGISEIYVRDNAELHFSMIHHWSEKTMVRPRSAIEIGNNARFVSNYLSLNPVKDMQMYPTALCNGINSRASFNSIIFADKQSKVDVGSKVVLNGKNSNADIISRSISKGKSEVFARGLLIANNRECKGHLECMGLLLGGDTKMSAIPELIVNVEGAELSHEAAVGKLADKEIQYLMTRGLSESEATSAIIRGFMDIGILGLPQDLKDEINHIMYDMDFGA
ncbi:MAG TPA: SufD family Fe-S cluster assembly protein [Candidatus Deferrimicrobium sp.]|nr:SufD family Fe-S cluster assembly protein [Candidatus Deferrimicrobium sp.]